MTGGRSATHASAGFNAFLKRFVASIAARAIVSPRAVAFCFGSFVLSHLVPVAGLAQGAPDLTIARATSGEAAPGRSWPEEKCRRYRAVWQTLSARTGRRGLGQAFIERHEAFIASGCTTQGDVCPRSAEELEAANALTIMAMNAGMASTFLPFGCPKPPASRN